MLYENPEIKFGGTWIKMTAGRVLWNTDEETSYSEDDLINAGLPNITGSFTGLLNGSNGGTGTHSGAFRNSGQGGNKWGGNSSWSNTTTETFDASRSNSIYGNSTTVQPPAIKVHMWKRIS